LVKPFKIWIPTRQDSNISNKITNPNVDLWFTDGSGINDCFGAEPQGKYFCGQLSTVFSVEKMAILRCADYFWPHLLRKQGSFSSTCKNHH
jgi:hypothetical protein